MGPSGTHGEVPRAGYYPDPSIPGYIRYWNGSSWVPGTSRPEPREGEPMPAPPPVASSPAAAPAPPPAPRQDGPAGPPVAPRRPASEETGPVFLDEESDSGPEPRSQGFGPPAAADPRGGWGGAAPVGGPDGRGAATAEPPAAQGGREHTVGLRRSGAPHAGSAEAQAGPVPGQAGPDRPDSVKTVPAQPHAAGAAQGDPRPAGTGQDTGDRQPPARSQEPGAAAGAGTPGPEQGRFARPEPAAQAGPASPGRPQVRTGRAAGGPAAQAAGPDEPAVPAQGPPGSAQPSAGDRGGAVTVRTGPGAEAGTPDRAAQPAPWVPGRPTGSGAAPDAAAGRTPEAKAPARQPEAEGAPAPGPRTGAPGDGPGAGVPGQPGPAAAGGTVPFGGAPGVPEAAAPGVADRAAGAVPAPAPSAVPSAASAAAPAAGATAPAAAVPAPVAGGPAPVGEAQGGAAPSWSQPPAAGLPAAPQSGGPDAVTPWRPPVDDPFARVAAREARPAGLGRRFGARLVDLVLTLAVGAGAAVPFVGKAVDHIEAKVDAVEQAGVTQRVWLIDGTTGGYLALVLGVLLVFGLLYEVWPTARWGRTLGKKLFGVSVVNIEGHEKPAFTKSLLRWLVYGVLGVLVVGVVNLLWCFVDRPWRQCWHDKVAGTFVAKGGPDAGELRL
ncbi:RDD family protein [Streptomyces albus]|uniref:RDD family protein n=1 Tax=Streptomyces albus TaxID=1888 RepID=UPI003F4CE300